MNHVDCTALEIIIVIFIKLSIGEPFFFFDPFLPHLCNGLFNVCPWSDVPVGLYVVINSECLLLFFRSVLNPFISEVLPAWNRTLILQNCVT
jgi:hypothetical protein